MSRALGLARAWLGWRSRGGPVARAIARLPRPGAPVSHRRAAAVQLEIRAYPSAADFAAHVGGWCARAAAEGAGLVVFPEDVATGLVGLLPGFGRLAGAPSPEAAAADLGASVADVFTFLGPFAARIYRLAFSRLARRYRQVIVAGTALLPEGGRLVNLCHVFGPDGSLLGVQPKLHLFPYEAAWGLARGEELRVFATPSGRLAAPVCMDATYFETFRVARSLGAEIVCLPSANPDAWSFWKDLRGPWPRVQESQVYALQSCLVGDFLGLTLSGRAACYAPLPLTPEGDGVLARVDDPSAEGLAVAELDLEALADLRRRVPLALPTEFCRRHLLPLY